MDFDVKSFIRSRIIEKYGTMKNFFDETDIKSSTLYSSLKTGSDWGGFSFQYIINLCEYLDIPVTVFYGKNEGKTLTLSDKGEISLVLAYRDSPELHEAVKRVLKIDEENQEK